MPTNFDKYKSMPTKADIKTLASLSDMITTSSTGPTVGEYITGDSITITTDLPPGTSNVLKWNTAGNYWDYGVGIIDTTSKMKIFKAENFKDDPFTQCSSEEEIEYVEHKIKELLYEKRDKALKRVREAKHESNGLD